MRNLVEWLRRLERVVKLVSEWERMAKDPFTNRERLAAAEQAIGWNVVELVRQRRT